MELRKCSTTGMMFPEDFFSDKTRRNNRSAIGVLWYNMSQRAVNGRYAETRRRHYPRNSHHRRGVRMYQPWVNDPAAFAWYILTELGYPRTRNGEKLTLDRIDNEGHYVPGNLRWATSLEQYENSEAGLDHSLKWAA